MKLKNKENYVKVPIDSLRLSKNVRKEFDHEGIKMLAQSIRRDGLMNPITVRPPIEDENGVKIYEIIAGERRFWAHKWLCDHGDDFTMVECCVRTGDTWTLQMIENVQRTDLSQREKEDAISEAMDKGMTMTEIAEKLCKPISYVSDIVAGIKVRRAADEAALDTDEISTKALSQLRSIPKEKQPEAVKELKKRGGSVRAATEILNEIKPRPPKANENKSALPNGLKVGDFVSHHGERLHSADLFAGMCVIRFNFANDGAAQVVRILDNDYYRVKASSTEEKKIDVELPIDSIDGENMEGWLFAIDGETFPAEAKVIEEPEIEPLPAPLAESKPKRKNSPGANFFMRIQTCQAKNKLQKLVLEKISPFQHMLIGASGVSDFFQKLQNAVAALCKEFPHTTPMTVEISNVGEISLITCRPANDPLFFTLFTISFTKLRGFAEDFFNDL